MTTPDYARFPRGIDPRHVALVTSAAGQPGERSSILHDRDGTVRVQAPSRQAARAAESALDRVGYHVTRPVLGGGREITVRGWSADRLAERLTAMQSAMRYLGTRPALTAQTMLNRIAGIPADQIPYPEELTAAAGKELREWITARCGVLAPCHPDARPPDALAAIRLDATVLAGETITELAAHQLRIAWHAAQSYPFLRAAGHAHPDARDNSVAIAAEYLDWTAPPGTDINRTPGDLDLQQPAPDHPGYVAAEFPNAAIPGPPPLHLAGEEDRAARPAPPSGSPHRRP